MFEHLRQIKLHKKQQFSESLENLTGTLETPSQSAKEALQNNTLDLTKITMIETRQRRINTEIESNFDGSKKLNVVGGTLLRLFVSNCEQIQHQYALWLNPNIFL